jgi:hypothetical protein
MTIEDCRRFYADEIRFAANIRNGALVEAFARVPREKFLGDGPWHIGSPELRGLSITNAFQMSYTAVTDPCDVYHNVADRSGRNAQGGSRRQRLFRPDTDAGCDLLLHLGTRSAARTTDPASHVGRPHGREIGAA